VPSWRTAVVLLIALTLSFTVAMRFLDRAPVSHPSAQSSPSRAMRQHMAADATFFERPSFVDADVILPVEAHRTLPEVPHVSSVELLDSLYNRPPPSLSLL
jgi:hypothetical protein